VRTTRTSCRSRPEPKWLTAAASRLSCVVFGIAQRIFILAITHGTYMLGDDVGVNEALRAELLEHARRDQAARESLLPGHDMRQWEQTVAPVDRANTARLREIVAEHGWPGHHLVGEAAAHAAWLLAQHAPPDFQEECLPLLEDAVARGDASARDLAYLTDRVLMHRGQPQVYGTQYIDRDGVLTLWTVREPADLGERRAALGLEPEGQNRERLLAARRREQQPG
jgi:hypothetical protein